jgi:hypothetical protein
MQPLAQCPRSLLSALRGVLCDIDDTLTTEGQLTAEAYAAMERLQHAGFALIPVTGRPAGWCDHIARMWPVDGVVGENGAFWFCYDRDNRRMLRRYVTPVEERHAQAERLRTLAHEILRQVPGARVSADQPYREADLAIDFREDVPPLAQAAVERIVALMQAAGLTAKVSSIHVNGWFGHYDKRTTTLALLQERFGVAAEAARRCYAFIGDSPNDEPMFAAFDCSIGVANVTAFAPSMQTAPRYVTAAACGRGFAEFADSLLRAAARA